MREVTTVEMVTFIITESPLHCGGMDMYLKSYTMPKTNASTNPVKQARARSGPSPLRLLFRTVYAMALLQSLKPIIIIK